MRLKEHQVAIMAVGIGAKEMIETDLKDFSGRGVARDMTAQLAIRLVGTHHHRQRIPAQNRGDALLQVDVAWMNRLLLERNGIAVGRIRQSMHQDIELQSLLKYLALRRLLFQLLEQKYAARFAESLDHRLQSFQPFPSLLGIGI